MGNVQFKNCVQLVLTQECVYVKFNNKKQRIQISRNEYRHEKRYMASVNYNTNSSV